ncbi:uncharacterized protein LOC127261785 [Andrographis paniculata]|uniref:uncharacterized protein LOC127261785 n=1 Tax=Andrographis paniculata TaxID=175694 RepID=UPI0021E84D0F|nr:uncharacterized protein LOC127261785 [Andrographis paniculata]XP_051146143.1 uncharacterized protein LOC127261785 [Andrographis paniculata]
MLSFPKTITTFRSQAPHPLRHPRYIPPVTAIQNNGGDRNDNNVSGGEDSGSSSPPTKSRITPPNTVEIRFKRGSRKRRKQEAESAAEKIKLKPAPKDWDSMTLTEKLVEVYVGEKGLLFWLNKFAYASIFIVIGGWIVFRFVGPAFNLYQLDTPPLSPTSMFK